MFCPKCGTWIPEGRTDCAKCNGTMQEQGPIQFHDHVKLDVTGAISKAWDLFTASPWPFLGVTLIYLTATMILGVPNYIAAPFEEFSKQGNTVFLAISLVLWLTARALSFFFTQPLLALAYHLFLQQTRSSKLDFAEAFTCIARHFWQLVLLNLIISLLYLAIIAATALPVLAIAGTFAYKNLLHTPEAMALLIGIGSICFILAMIAITFIMIRLFMSNIMIIDRNIGAMQAIRQSGQAAAGNYPSMFGYFVMLSLIMIAGILLCCVGMIPAMALALTAHVSLYEQLRA
jgi:uncharacterized membrane protein